MELKTSTTPAPRNIGIGILRVVHIGNHARQRPIVAQASGQHEGDITFDAFVHHALSQTLPIRRLALFHRHD